MIGGHKAETKKIVSRQKYLYADDSKTTPAISTPHPASRHGPTCSRRISIPMSAPTIIDISRIGATRLSGAPDVSAASTRI